MERPYVLVNMAMSADGKVDTVERRGARVSSAADLARVDALRARSDAVMVGGRTLLGEDPRLTVRDPYLVELRRRAGLAAQPTKVAVASRVPAPGSTGALPTPSRFLGEGGGQVVVFTTSATDDSTSAWLRDEGAQVHIHAGHRVDLARALEQLAVQGIGRLMAEGGGTLVAELVTAGLVDELGLFVAPLLLGGATAPTPMGGPGLRAAEAVRPTLADVLKDEDGGVTLRYVLGTWAGPRPYDVHLAPDGRSPA